MKIKPTDYSAHLIPFQLHIKRYKNPIDSVAEYAARSFVPVIALFKMLEEIYGSSEELTKRIEKQLKFENRTLE